MKISKIDVVGYPKLNNFKTKNCINSNTQINGSNELSNLFGASFGLFFEGTKTVHLNENEAALEKDIVQKARSLGVSTPEIKDSTYTLSGKTADINSNPITQEHIENVLNNILIMDKAGFAHGDIEKAHVFYCKDGSVEFDCFRFNWTFDDTERVDWEFPKFCYPTNLKQFEGNSVGEYLTQMDTEEKKYGFLKSYLEKCSDFHSERADFIEESKPNAQAQVEYEKLQAKMFENPDRNTVELFKNKIELLYKARLAFTEWDEGGGACGHEIDEKRMIKSVCMNFEIISDTLDYIKKIEESKKSSKGNKLKYLDYELEYAHDMLKKTKDSNAGMANWTIDPDNPNSTVHKNIASDKRKDFMEKSEDLKNTDTKDKDFETKAKQLQKMYLDFLRK